MPRASNDNKMGIVKSPRPAVTRRVGPISPAMPVPRPWVPPFSAPAELLVSATEIAFYSQSNPAGALEWNNTWHCQGWSGWGIKYLNKYNCNGGRDPSTSVYNPKNYAPWSGQANVSYYNYSHTAGSYDYYEHASSWTKAVLNPQYHPLGYPNIDVAFPLPQPFPAAPPTGFPKPRCGMQPSIKPKPMFWPQGNPDLPPFVDAQSASEAGFSPPSTAYTIKPNGKASARPIASPTGKPKAPKGKKEPNKGQNLGKGGKALWIGTGAASEGVEIMQAAYDALPEHAKQDVHRDAYGNATKDPVPTIPEMLHALADYGSQIDTEQFIENVLNNQIEDYFYGGLSKGVKPLSQQIGHKTGLDRAAGAGGRNVEEDEDDPLLPTVSLDASSCSIKISW